MYRKLAVSLVALSAVAACSQEKKTEQAEAPPQDQQQQLAAQQQQPQDYQQQAQLQQQGFPQQGQQQQGFGQPAQQGFGQPQQQGMQQGFPQDQSGFGQQQGFPQDAQSQHTTPNQGFPTQQQGFGQQQGFPQQAQQGFPQQQGFPADQQQQQFPQQDNSGFGQQPSNNGFGQQPNNNGFGQQPAPGGNMDALMAQERQDFGVAPTSELHSGAMHGPTPTSIPGGQAITTQGVVSLMQNNQVRPVILDVLGGPEVIPGSVYAVPAHAAGAFNDQTQQQLTQFLQQATGGNKQTPLVFYCLSTQCWMSYNASLRAINLGYTNVLWYRGGIEAWKAAGQQVQPSQGGFHQ